MVYFVGPALVGLTSCSGLVFTDVPGLYPREGGPLNPYEMTFIIRPDRDEDGTRAVAESVTGRISAAGGEIIAAIPWNPPRRRMAYPIKDFGDGFYVTTVFRIDPSALRPIENTLKLNENILRFLIVQATDLNIKQAQQRCSNSRPRLRRHRHRNSRQSGAARRTRCHLLRQRHPAERRRGHRTGAGHRTRRPTEIEAESVTEPRRLTPPRPHRNPRRARPSRSKPNM